MYTGNNPTALKSQEMLMDAMTRLLRGKSFAGISIKELCREADISRQTFYLLFSTKENILSLRFERIFAVYVAVMRREPNLSTQKVADWFVQFLQNEREFISQLVSNGLTPVMLRHFRRYLREVDSMIQDRQSPMREYATAFLAGALVELAAEYVRDDNPPPAEQVSGLIREILTGYYFNMESY